MNQLTSPRTIHRASPTFHQVSAHLENLHAYSNHLRTPRRNLVIFLLRNQTFSPRFSLQFLCQPSVQWRFPLEILLGNHPALPRPSSRPSFPVQNLADVQVKDLVFVPHELQSHLLHQQWNPFTFQLRSLPSHLPASLQISPLPKDL